MKASFIVTVRAGKRTPVEVDVYAKSVNQKTFILSNGKTVTEDDIIRFIEADLTKILMVMAGESVAGG